MRWPRSCAAFVVALIGCAESRTQHPAAAAPPSATAHTAAEDAAGDGVVRAGAPAAAGPAGAPASDPRTSGAPSPLQPETAQLFGACASTGTLEASLRPTHLLFLIDRSASMACNLPPLTDSAACEQTPARADPSRPSKWDVVRRALADVIATLPPGTRPGLGYLSNDDRCGVQSRPAVALGEPDAAQLARFDDSLASVEPRGGTPLVGGLILAYKHLNPDQTPELPSGHRVVVLLTDGEESCAPEQTARLLEEELPKSRAAAITTFVVGVPGSEVNRAFLSQLAYAGGTPIAPSCDYGGSDPTQGDCHFDMTRDVDLAASLATALSAISGEALRCEVPVPQPSAGGTLDHDQVNVVYAEHEGGDEQLVAMDATRPCDGGAHGWQYNDDKSAIVLCGDACERVQRAASLRIALGCKSVAVQ